MSESKKKTTIEVSIEIHHWLASLGMKNESNDTILRRIRDIYRQKSMKMNEAVVDQWGKASIGRPHKGKIIEWRVKDDNP